MNLPDSFNFNGSERMLQFLNESNRIEGITQVDYQKQNAFRIVDQGHFGALVDSQRMAVQRESLTVRKIKHWQALITHEQIGLGHHIEEHEIGHIRNSSSLPKNVRIGSHVPPHYESVPTLLDHLVEQINEGLKDQNKLENDVEYCKFLGRSFQKFESIHPFADGNGRVGRLIANYIATFCHRPIIVFNSEMIEKNEYYRAHSSKEEMSCFMAKKIQEAIFRNGQIFIKTNKDESLTGFYQSRDGNDKILYEWHSLGPILNPGKEAVKVTRL